MTMTTAVRVDEQGQVFYKACRDGNTRSVTRLLQSDNVASLVSWRNPERRNVRIFLMKKKNVDHIRMRQMTVYCNGRQVLNASICVWIRDNSVGDAPSHCVTQRSRGSGEDSCRAWCGCQ